MTQVNKNKIKVLIADDEAHFASTLATRLKIRNFNTSMANSGEETIKKVEQNQPDVLILDFKMPDLDGLEVLAKLKEMSPAVQVIILTGHGSFQAGQTGMELGAFDYIMKPVNLNILIEKIESAYQALK